MLVRRRHQEETSANIRDAIREYLDAAKELAGRENWREVEIQV
jgi:hypothetical protein